MGLFLASCFFPLFIVWQRLTDYDRAEDKDNDELLRHVVVFCLANNFKIARLRNYALRHFEAKVREFWPVRADIFCLIIKNIYFNTTPENGDILRESVVKFVVYNPTQFFQESCFYDVARWDPEFGEACIRELAGAVERPVCPGFADDERSSSISSDESESEYKEGDEEEDDDEDDEGKMSNEQEEADVKIKEEPEE